jgi:toxin ParE1/3/4
MTLEWSRTARSDLDRFAEFLKDRHPSMAQRVAAELVAKADLIERQPLIGQPLEGRAEYRQIALRVLNARYVFRYRIAGERIVILRVYHGREARP